MKIVEIKEVIMDQFPGSVIESEELSESQVELKPDQWFEIATFMKEDPDLDKVLAYEMAYMDWIK